MVSIIIGGSGSGKSEFAENYIGQRASGNGLVYIATMKPFDEEMRRRIQKHQQMRLNKKFTTIECFTDLHRVEISAHSFVLLECMSNLVANEMFLECDKGVDTVKKIMSGVKHIINSAKDVVIVTNNIFEDGYQYDSTTLEYMDVLGEINRKICCKADKVIEVVHGIDLVIVPVKK